MAFVNLNPVEFQNVNIVDGFWRKRIHAVCRETAWACIDECEKTHRVDNFRRAGGLQEGSHEGIFFNDSDVYKVLEGIAYVLLTERDDKLEAKADEIIDAICAAQQADGYLFTYFILNTPENRWVDMAYHEAYCIGHMIEGAIAYAQATGKDKWLQAACRAVDQMMSVNGPEGQHWVTGHQEIELALVRLYRYTGEDKYLRYAHWLVEERGHGYLKVPLLAELDFFVPEYCQDDKPVCELERVTGHAVRAMYYYSAITDLAAIMGKESYDRAMQRIWKNIVPANLYITGGIGQSAQNEGFTRDWSLPNLTAYCETCAAIGMALWNQRMNFTHAESKYADIVELEMYNGILSGLSLKGDKFFYGNPLSSVGNYHRRRWFGCSCCPTNLVRFLPSVGGYAYATGENTIYINQFIYSDAVIDMPEGKVGLKTVTEYPWDGKVQITVTECVGSRLMKIRKPNWCNKAVLMVNSKVVDNCEAGYYTVMVKQGDRIDYKMEMETRRVYADKRVAENIGRVAIMRGPIVFCAEETDNPGIPSEYFHADKTLSKHIELSAKYYPDLLEGVVVVEGKGIKLVPYFAWDNRDAGGMAVWLREA
jgi:DUF1680 family protein